MKKDLASETNLEAFQKQQEELKAILSRFKDGFKRSSEIYHEKIESILNELKSAEKGMSKTVGSIPKDINIKKTEVFEIKDKTKLFLAWFFSFSVVIWAFLLWFGMKNFKHWENKRNLEAQNQWFSQYYDIMSEKNPNSNDKAWEILGDFPNP